MNELSYQEFVDRYHPISNPFNPVSLFQGTLFSTQDFSRIAPQTMQNRVLWTVLEEQKYNEEASKYFSIWKARPGQQSGKLVGYFVTEVPYDYGENIEVNLH